MDIIKRSIRQNSLRIAMFAAMVLVAGAAVTNANANVINVSTTIQAAIDAAQPGDTVLVPPGIYRENVRVTKDHLTIQGPHAAILDGAGLAGNTGIRVGPAAPATRINGFTISGFTIQNYSRNGLLLLRVDDFRISEGDYFNNDEYGIFPIFSTDGLIASNRVLASDDAGIYVGQSSGVIIEKNYVRDCTSGIEIENSSNITARNNTAEGNSVGILVQVLPGLIVTNTSNIKVTANRLIANNRPNPVTNPDDVVSLLPSGIGFLNIAGDDVALRRNIAIQNQTAGIVVAQLPSNIAALDPRIDPFPDNNEIRDNVTMQNGNAPDPKIAPFPGSDFLWDGSGTWNCWAGNTFKTSFPALPTCP